MSILPQNEFERKKTRRPGRIPLWHRFSTLKRLRKKKERNNPLLDTGVFFFLCHFYCVKFSSSSQKNITVRIAKHPTVYYYLQKYLIVLVDNSSISSLSKMELQGSKMGP